MAQAAKKIRVVVADDESRARRLVRTRLEEIGGYEVVGEAETGAEAAEMIARLCPDIVILDIQMPQGTGVEIFERVGVEKMPATVFVTAYSEFAVKAFELYAVDYLLKPFTKERFAEALARAGRRIEGGTVSRKEGGNQDSGRKGGMKEFIEYYMRAQGGGQGVSAPTLAADARKEGAPLQRIVVTTVEPWRSVEVGQILWLEAEDHFVRVHVEGGQEYLVAGKISDYEEQLERSRFMRVHRGAIVRLGGIRRTVRVGFGGLEVELTDGTRIRVSRGRKAAVRVALLGVLR